MADRRWAPSVAARTAVAAGLVAAILLVGAGLWLRDYVYDERMDAAREKAYSQRDMLDNAARTMLKALGQAIGAESAVSYEVVRSDGKVLASTFDIKSYEIGGRPVMPPPKWQGHRVQLDAPVTFGTARQPLEPDAPREWDRFAGRTIEVRGVAFPEYGYSRTRPSVPRRSIALYVFVTPFAAEEARTEVDQVMRRLIPPAVLLVMLVAYAATRTGLRSVDRIRAQAAAITSRDLSRRVPVPPTRDAVSRLARTLNETLERLQRSSDQQRRFVADVTHELRSPVASLRAVLDVAVTHADRADWPTVADDAIADLDRIQTLVDDLLMLARFDADHPAASEPVDLAGLIARHLAGRAPYDAITVRARTSGEVLVDGSARELERLVRNLVDNAERHARSAVLVSVTADAGEAVIEVADDSPGIPPADRIRVFERFFRLDEARSRDEGGAGLGLAIAHDIVVRHHGTITVGSSASGGSLLRVVLPLRGED